MIALANSEADVISKVAIAADALGLDVVDCEEIEPLRERIRRFSVEEAVLELADRVTEAEPVGFDEFCTFPLDEGTP